VSNFTKVKPVGIDANIQAFQTLVFNQLLSAWGLGSDEFNMYGRAYRNQTDDGYTPEVYIGNKEYQEVYFDDTLAALAFFGVKENIAYEAGSTTADVFLIVMINLNRVSPENERQDEEVRIQAATICSQIRSGFKLTGITTGIDSVFSEYSGWRKKDGIKFRDQHPFHCFRLNFKLLYNIKNY
jgi:hypothetical protein